MATKRLAIVHSAFQTAGGAEVLALAQAQLFVELGFSPEFHVFSWSPGKWEDKLRGIPVRARSAEHAAVPRSLSAQDLDWLAAGLAGCDVVLAHNLPASTAVAQLPLSVPRIWYCHEPPRWLHVRAANPFLASHRGDPRALAFSASRHFLKDRLLPASVSRLTHGWREQTRRADLAHIPQFDAAWTNSEFSRGLVQSTYGNIPAQVAYPCIELNAPVSQRHGLRRDELRIVCITRLEPTKNVDTLVRAVAALHRRGLPVQLDIIGSGQSLRALRALARFMGVAERVTFHGYVDADRLAELTAAAEVFAMLPVDEPFGMVFAEAMLRGLIVVGSNQGGPREILEGGDLGFTADPYSLASIVEALERAFRLSDADADDLRDRAARSCRARFSRSVIRARFSELFQHYL